MDDVELLPCGECGMPCRAGEYHPFAACLMFKACHNSETVRANIAPLQAENERLRAEVERSERYAEQSERERLWAEARAERLAEALRWYAEQAQLCRKFGSEGDAARHALSADGGKRANRALTQEDRND